MRKSPKDPATRSGPSATQLRPRLFVTAPYGACGKSQRARRVRHRSPRCLDISSASRAGIEERRASAHTGAGPLPPRRRHHRRPQISGLMNLRTSLDVLRELNRETVSVSTSTSLLHVPYTVEQETALPVDVASWLSFAEEKVTEVVGSRRATEAREARGAAFELADRARRHPVQFGSSPQRCGWLDPRGGLRHTGFRTDSAMRHAAQQTLGIPERPTTTIGWFPRRRPWAGRAGAHGYGPHRAIPTTPRG